MGQEMAGLQELMANHHRDCDDDFARIEQAVATSDWVTTARVLATFVDAMERHLGAEEQVLFPAFESATGMTMGPTRVMRMEHAQMRSLFEEMRDAVLAQDADGVRGQAETLLIMMQQHNLKEENVLYPMCDQHLQSQVDELCAQLTAAIGRA